MQVDRTPTGTPSGTPDQHTEWMATIDIAWRLMEDTVDISDAEMSRLSGEVARCQDLIAETPACSIDGVICQIKVGHHTADGLAPGKTGMLALEKAIAALEQLGRA